MNGLDVSVEIPKDLSMNAFVKRLTEALGKEVTIDGKRRVPV